MTSPSYGDASQPIATQPSTFLAEADSFEQSDCEETATVWGRLFPETKEFDTLGESWARQRQDGSLPSDCACLFLQRLFDPSPQSTLRPVSLTELTEATYVFGRHPTCSVTFSDPVISNRHCVITRERPLECASQYESGEYVVFVQDTSSNGTFVNGKRIGNGKRIAIKHGDHIAVTQKRSAGAGVCMCVCVCARARRRSFSASTLLSCSTSAVFCSKHNRHTITSIRVLLRLVVPHLADSPRCRIVLAH